LEAERLISLEEAAALSGLSDAHLRRLAEQGRLRARKIARNWVTTEEAVTEYLNDRGKRSHDPHKYKRSS
jgi:excisionase family DNA binding protein